MLAVAACDPTGSPLPPGQDSALAAAAAAPGYPGSCTSSSVKGVPLTTCDLAPSSPSWGISPLPPALGDFHHVVLPTALGARKNVLVVFLGGSVSVPNAYQTISAEAAALGYGVLDLRYPDSVIVGSTCSTQSCFTGLRGMTVFGEGVSVPGVLASPYSYDGSVLIGDSVINRVVNLLDTLATYDSYWSQFLTDTASPYKSPHHPQVLPAWSKVVFAGHSQGGGDATLIGTQLPSLRRVIAFSSPDDHVGSASASWIAMYPQSGTELPRFWGMRDTMEGLYSECTSYNWNNLGGVQSGCIVLDEAVHNWEYFVNRGATQATGQRFLVTTDRPNPPSLYAHDSTAVDDNIVDGSDSLPFSTDRTVAWDYLFTAN